MWRRQEIKKIKYLFVFMLLLLLPALAGKDVVYAAEKWILWHGVENLGYVLVLKVNEHNLAPIDVVAAKLKLEVSSNEKSFLAKKGENTLELVPGAAVAKRDGHNIIPLTSIPTYKDGHWWLEANTTLKLLTPLVGDGKTLKWAGKTEATTDDFVVSDVVVRGDVKKIEQSSSASFATKIVGLRWGQWEDRVRLVLDLSSDVSPFVEKKPSKLVLKFNGVLVDDLVKDIKQQGPFPEVSVNQRNGTAIIEIEHSFHRISYFNLSSPPRYVVDFFINEGLSSDVTSQKSTDDIFVPSQVRDDPKRAAPKGSKPRLVVIDPGHGGKDPGAVANGIREKDINLKVGQILIKVLEKRGIKARLTRSQDIYLRLDERTKLANDWDGDLFVSLHCNALPAGRSARGIEIYIMALPTDEDAMKLALIENRELGEGTDDVNKIADKRTKLLLQILGDMEQNVKIEQSLSFAEVLYKAGNHSGLNMRRVAQAPFFVLRGATMPAVLVEMGFLTDKSEAALLANANYQKRVADSLADGIESYLRSM